MAFEAIEEVIFLDLPLYTRLNKVNITFEFRAVDAEEYYNELKKLMPSEIFDAVLGPEFLEMAKEMESELGKDSFGFLLGNGTGTQTVELTQLLGECTDHGHDIPEIFPVLVMGSYEQGKLDLFLEHDFSSDSSGAGIFTCPGPTHLEDSDIEFDYFDSGIWAGKSIAVNKDAKETVTDSGTIEADLPEYKCNSLESWSFEATVEPL